MKPADIKKLRLKLGLSQEQLAHLIGVSFSTINRWEMGKSYPSNLAMDKIKSLENKENE